METMNFIPVHTNHFQVSGDTTQSLSSSTMMVRIGDEAYLETCSRDQNCSIGDTTLLDWLPEEIQQRLLEEGGSIQWGETYNTQTWEGHGGITVYDIDGNELYRDGYDCDK